MNEEIKAKWLVALRSGEYKQARHQLRAKSGYCCLGVLCDAAAMGEWKQYDEDQSFIYSVKGNSTFTSLSLEMCEIVGLRLDDHSKLVDMNDSGKTFAEIADWIEANL